MINFKLIGQFLGEHGGLIGAGVGVVCTVAVAVVAAKNTRKFDEALEKAKDEKTAKETDIPESEAEESEEKETSELSKKEKVGVFLKSYWPTLVTATIGVTGIIFSYKFNMKKLAATTAACAALSTKYDKLKKAVMESEPEDLAKNAKEAIFGSINGEEVCIDNLEGSEKCLVKDAWTGVEFESTPYKVKNGILEFKDAFYACHFQIDLNSLFDYIGEPCSDSNMGDIFGWVEEVTGRSTPDISVRAYMSEDGRPGILIDYTPDILTDSMR